MKSETYVCLTKCDGCGRHKTETQPLEQARAGATEATWIGVVMAREGHLTPLDFCCPECLRGLEVPADVEITISTGTQTFTSLMQCTTTPGGVVEP